MEFDTAARPVVEVRIATSYISLEQAARNLKTETEGGFEAVRARTAAAWEKQLQRIEIAATEDQKRTFYTCLYRAEIPHRFFEIDAEGKKVHYSPWDGRVHDGVEYVDSGLWDTFRTQFPFYSIAYPEQLGEIVAGWLNAYREGGRLPNWPNPADSTAWSEPRRCDGCRRAWSRASRLRRADRLRSPSPRCLRRAGRPRRPARILALGYMPPKVAGDCVSAPLDYAYDDWCVAQAAKFWARTTTTGCSWNARKTTANCGIPQVGFMRGKNADGTWANPEFDEFAWGHGYCEGGPWQCSWAVQHDPLGLAELLGGKEAMAAKLDRMFASLRPRFIAGGYGITDP